MLAAILALVFVSNPAQATGCSFETQGEGRVANVVDARTVHLEDGRDVSLAGIEPVMEGAKADRTAAIVTGHETLRGQDDRPDR